MRLGDLAAQHEPDAGSAGFRREERDEQVGGVRQAGPVIFDPELQRVGRAAETGPSEADPAPGLAGRIHGVPHEVDEELLELVAIRVDGHGRPGLNRDPFVPFEADDPLDERRNVERRELRRRQAGEPRIGGHEPAQRLRACRDDGQAPERILLPVFGRRVSLQERRQAAGDGLDRRQRVVHLVADDADQPLPREPLFLAQRLAQIGEHQHFVGPAPLPERAAADLPPPRARGEGRVEHPRRFT